MPKLTEINIKNLRGLTDLTLEDARVFNLLVGPSEIGKTTVLEGIFIGSSFAYVQGFLSVNQFRGAILNNEEKNRQAVNTLFRNITEEKIHIKTKIEKGGMNYSCDSEFSRLRTTSNGEFSINGGQHNQFALDRDLLGVSARASVAGDAAGNRRVDLIVGGQQFELKEHGHEFKVKGEPKEGAEINDYFPESHFSPFANRNLFDAAANATIHNQEEKIIEVLRKINPKIKKFETIGQQVYVDIGLPTKQPIYITGNGLDEILFTLGSLSMQINIILLDEIACGLYYASLKDYLRATLRFAKEQGKQVFATTHRKDMIVALAEVVAEEEDLREDVMCYGLSRDKHGVTRAYGHNHRAIRHSVDNDIEIR